MSAKPRSKERWVWAQHETPIAKPTDALQRRQALEQFAKNKGRRVRRFGVIREDDQEHEGKVVALFVERKVRASPRIRVYRPERGVTIRVAYTVRRRKPK